MSARHAPVSDVVDEVLFEHEAPLLDYVEQGLSERARVDAEPALEHDAAFHRLHVLVDRLVRVDLPTAGQRQRWITHSANCAKARCLDRHHAPPPPSGDLLASALTYGITLFACCELTQRVLLTLL